MLSSVTWTSRLCASCRPLQIFLSKEYACYDWTRLGLFTGSRIGEYGQSKIPMGVRYAAVPLTQYPGIWAGTSIAFIESDFTFYDAQPGVSSSGGNVSSFRRYCYYRGSARSVSN